MIQTHIDSAIYNYPIQQVPMNRMVSEDSTLCHVKYFATDYRVI